ncbi:MAG: hypothetical protein B6D41_00125 [Chloroflexi bacterium UTCFX4]|jgi:hypothetical protein|nr:MAG: hypothetical protein B6D41_00125 [Chloroflexi bacterium UTCFX4]
MRPDVSASRARSFLLECLFAAHFTACHTRASKPWDGISVIRVAVSFVLVSCRVRIADGARLFDL